ncbi:molybdate ABC transporter substrate-binding protein [Verrucomicrobiota bacterium]
MDTKQLVLTCVFVVVLCFLSFGCGKNQKADNAETAKTELLLYCGAGIRPAADALIEAFEQENDVKINATYAGSGRLLGQISSLQTGDLFMPGAELYVDKAIEKGLAVGETKRVAAYFVPVIFVEKENPKQIRSLLDLKKKGIRVGLGDERACAIGKQTLKLLEKNNISYSDIEKNVVYKSGTVNELGLAVQLKNVDAVVLWDANARHFMESGMVVPIPMEDNLPAVIPIVLLRSSRYSEEAIRFIDFVTSENGRAILTEKGYTVSFDLNIERTKQEEGTARPSAETD